VTIICLGPLTNIARAIRRDPAIATMIHRVIMVGGSIAGIGNISPMAEFNFYFDPQSAREVMKSAVTKTLVPLDVTSEVAFGLDLLSELPEESTRSGFFLRQMLPHAFRAYRQHLGQEAITLNDAVGALAALEPELFEFDEMACDVETQGEMTRGVTVFDRRSRREWRPNVEVAIGVDVERARQMLLDLLMISGKASSF
jgi:purine nucleosidase